MKKMKNLEVITGGLIKEVELGDGVKRYDVYDNKT